MKQEEIVYAIDHQLKLTFTPICVITLTKAYRGYFETFEDSGELRKDNKFRFMEWQNVNALREELDKTGKLNKRYSTIIELKDIDDLKKCMTVYGAEALKNAGVQHIGRRLPTSDRKIYQFKDITLLLTINGDNCVLTQNIGGIRDESTSIRQLIGGIDNIINIEMKARMVEDTGLENPKEKMIDLEYFLGIL